MRQRSHGTPKMEPPSSGADATPTTNEIWTRYGSLSRSGWTVAASLGFLLLLLVLSPSSSAAAPPAHSAAPSAPGTAFVAMPAISPSLPAGATAIAAVASSTPEHFTFEYAVPPSAAETAYMNGLYTPGSPYYHHYLVDNQFFDVFGPSNASVAAFQSYLTGDGLSVQYEDGPWIYYATGTAGEVDRAFHTTLTDYELKGVSRSAPDSSLSVPSSFQGLIDSVAELNQFVKPAPDYLITPNVHPSATPLTTGIATPSILQTFYNASGLISGGDTGNKYNVGFGEECDPDQADTTYQSDLNKYISNYALSASTLQYLGSGYPTCGSSSGDAGWGIETDLDIESFHSLDSGATEYVCLDGTGNPDVCDQDFVTDQTSDNIDFGSNSFGGGSSDHSVWTSAKAAGVTLLASAGDSCEAVNYPAAEPDGLGVGGTTMDWSTGGAFSSETVWSCSSGEGTGGGCDTSDAPPSYQIGMTGYPGACSTTADRGVPDVGADANPSTGIDEYTSSSECSGPAFCQVGGTSLACPLWTASLDLIYTSAGASGFAGPTIYGIAKSANYPKAFHEITSGSNGYSATPGWNPDDGVGSMNIGMLAWNWTGGGSSGGPLTVSTPTASPSSVDVGYQVTWSTSASGGSGGNTFAWSSTPTTGLGCAATTSSSEVCTPTTAGTYTVSVTVTDSASTSASATSGSFTVFADPAVSAPVPSVSPGDVGQMFYFNSTSTNVGSGGDTYSWTFSALGVGCASANALSITCTPTAGGSYTATITVMDSNGGTGSATSTPLTVVALPAVSTPIASPTSVDVGTPVTFTSSLVQTGAGGDTYTWTASPSAGLGCVSANALSIQCTPTAAGGYQVTITVTDSAGNTGSATSKAFVVYALPTVVAPVPSRSSVDVGQTFHFSSNATVAAPGAYQYEWATAPVSGLGCLASTASTVICTPTVAGNWTVAVSVVDSNGGSATEKLQRFQVYRDPVVGTPIPSPSQVQTGQTTALTATATGLGSGGDSFAWVASATSASCAGVAWGVATCTDSVTGTFTVTVKLTDSNGFTASATSATITVTALSGSLTALPTADPVSGNAPLNVTFIGSASGGAGGYSYSWSFGDGTTSTVPSQVHDYVASGTYTATLTVTDSSDAKASASITITAATVGVGNMNIQVVANPTSPFVGANVVFTATATGGTPGYFYSWHFGDGSTGTGASPTHSFGSAQTYVVTVWANDSAGHSVYTSIEITVQAAPNSILAAFGPLGVWGIVILAAVLVVLLMALAVWRHRRRQSGKGHYDDTTAPAAFAAGGGTVGGAALAEGAGPAPSGYEEPAPVVMSPVSGPPAATYAAPPMATYSPPPSTVRTWAPAPAPGPRGAPASPPAPANSARANDEVAPNPFAPRRPR